jgi:hypothetical protein
MGNVLNFSNWRKLHESEEAEMERVKDFDHFGQIVKPGMAAAGFKYIDEPNVSGFSSYGKGYFCYPDHNTGVNLFLNSKLTDPWKYVVYSDGNKNKKEFGWPNGTDAEVKKAATDAVAYAVKLKKQFFPKG